MIKRRLTHMEMLYVALIILLLSACGGGGGGGSSAKKTTGPTLTMILGTPASDPAVIPPSLDGTPTQVTFLAMVTGTATPPASIQLDGIDSTGKVTAGVAQLFDDGKNADFKRGDRIFTGTLDINSKTSAEMNYRVSTTFNGKSIISDTMNLWVSDCPASSRPSDPAQIVFDSDTNTQIYANEVMLRTKVGVAPDLAAINTIAGAVNGHVVGCIPALRQYLVEITNPNTPADAAGVHAAINTLKQDTVNVESAFPNALSLAQPFSPLTNSLLCNGLVDANCQWYLDTIRAPKAWQLAGGGDPQMGVAVIDFGVDCTLNGLPCDAALNHQDTIDHGTGVAGIIGSPNNPTGMVGDAYNTYLYPYNFIGNTGSQYKMSELITAALSQTDVRVINISAGTGADFSNDIKNAVCHAISSGRLVVAAAGNPAGPDAANCELTSVYPAAYNASGATCDNGADLQSGLLVVGATDNNNNLANWTSGGLQHCSNTKYVDLYAPGKDVITLSSEYGYATKSGTSFAAPLVSGAAAVLWAEHPGSTPKEIHDQLVSSADSITTNSSALAGKPSLDLYHAVGGSDSIANPDTTPDSFTIPPLTGATLQGDVTSSAIKVSGIDSPAPISINGGFYSINGSSFTDAAGVVHNGDSIKVQVHTPVTINTKVEASLTIGSVSQKFTVTTGDLSTVPGGFVFPEITNASTGTSVESDPQQINTISDNTGISINSADGGEYAIGDGASADSVSFHNYTNQPGKLNKGQWVKVRVTSPSNYSHTARAQLTIGSFSGDFVVRTPRAHHTPNDFNLDPIVDSTPGTEVTSTPFVVGGLNGGALISISGGKYGVVTANSNGGLPSYTSINGIVHNGDEVTVKLSSPIQPGATASAMLTIGNVHRVFRVTTKSVDITPDAFSFASKLGNANNSTPSDTITIYGIDDGTPISVVNGDYAINGGAFSNSAGTINAGQTVQLSATLPTGANTATVILTIGDYTTTYTVTAQGTIVTPNTFSFDPVNNALMREPVLSKAVTVSGINAPAPISISPDASYSLDGGATFTSAVGTFSDGQSVIVKLKAAPTPATTSTATLNIGGSTANFTVTTVSVHTVTINPFVGGRVIAHQFKVIDGLSTWFKIFPDPGYIITNVSGCGDGGNFDTATNIYTTGVVTSNLASGNCNITVTSQDNQASPHTISGTVTGLAAGATLVLKNSDGDAINVSTTDSNYPNFTFATPVKSYHVTTSIDIKAGQICGVNNSSGESGRADVTNVEVKCIAIPRNNLSAGFNTSFEIRSDGSLWGWGWRSTGVLGDGTTSNGFAPAPEQIGTATNWVSVSTQFTHTLAVRDDGTLWAWGDNNSGDLGTGDTTVQYTPVQVGTDNHWAVVAAGRDDSLAIKTDGTLWAWGNWNGNSSALSPIQVGTDNNWAYISAGNSDYIYPVSMGITLNGTLMGWGDDSYGELLNSPSDQLQFGGEGPDSLVTFNPVPLATDKTWVKVSASQYGTVLAIASDGTLWAWGADNYGLLGFNPLGQSTPQQVGSDNSWLDVSAGYNHAVGLLCYDGCTVMAWGNNQYGQLGNGDTSGTAQNTPVPVQVYSNSLADGVSAGYNFSLFKQSLDGSLWGAGNNSSYTLGIEPSSALFTPAQIADSKGYLFHLVGGTISGLQTYDIVTLQNDPATPGVPSSTLDVYPYDNGTFTFYQSYPANTPYNVTIAVQPQVSAVNPTPTTCTITSGGTSNGVGVSANVTNVVVTCALP